MRNRLETPSCVVCSPLFFLLSWLWRLLLEKTRGAFSWLKYCGFILLWIYEWIISFSFLLSGTLLLFSLLLRSIFPNSTIFSFLFPLLPLSPVFTSSDPAATLFTLPYPLVVSCLVDLPCVAPPLHHIFPWPVPSSLPLSLLPCGHPFADYFFSLLFIFLLLLGCVSCSWRPPALSGK